MHDFNEDEHTEELQLALKAIIYELLFCGGIVYLVSIIS